MLTDAVRFTSLLKKLGYDRVRSNAVKKIVEFIEGRLGAEMIVRRESLPLGNEELLDAALTADVLKKSGVIDFFTRRVQLPDEPQLYMWASHYLAEGGLYSGGSSVTSDRNALIAALAESLERYVWQVTDDYFRNPFLGTEAAVSRKHAIAPLNSFAGFSDTQRAQNSQLKIGPEDQFLWIEGTSLISKKPIHLPAQVVSAYHSRRNKSKERRIRFAITTGLATGPTDEFAILNGMLECIERDAYVTWWLNKLTVPTFDPYSIASEGSSLRILLDRCAKYGLTVRAIQIPTDAPTHVLCAMVTDAAELPPFTLGVKAHRDPAEALEGALHEALRGRVAMRRNIDAEAQRSMKAEDVRLEHRLGYWFRPDRAERAKFAYAGPLQEFVHHEFENDSARDHIVRIIDWARRKGYEIIDVDLSHSKKNPLLLKIHMIVIPQLQPMHLSEKFQYLGGDRLKEIPEAFGYTARSPLFTDEPHPLA